MRIFGHRQMLNSLSIRQLSPTANSEVERLSSTANSEEEAPRRAAKWKLHSEQRSGEVIITERRKVLAGAKLATSFAELP